MLSSALSLYWALPFIGLLASIAFLPLAAPNFWHHHYGKISLFWVAMVLIPMTGYFGISVTLHEMGHTYGVHFLPFIVLLSTLFILSAGIKIEVTGTPRPLINMGFLLVACLSANFLGTVGAAMIFIRPFIALNQERRHKTHSLIFFIFLVCNIGGCLTAIGDPPLFLGFLMGVDFFWPLKALYGPFLLVIAPLLALYGAIDAYYYSKETIVKKPPIQIGFQGKSHVMLLIGAITFIVISGLWKSSIHIPMGSFTMNLQDAVRDGGLILIAAISYYLEFSPLKEKTNFSWEPMKEVAKLFAGIFMTASPVIAMLKGGLTGPFGFLITMVTNTDGAPLNKAYFWLTGGLSSFLDNAPTYLIFFNMMDEPATQMMTVHGKTLMAISLGSVFMGAMTYIGNAPNFMVKTIGQMHNIPMPGFFGYMAWSVTLLLPLFFLMSVFVF